MEIFYWALRPATGRGTLGGIKIKVLFVWPRNDLISWAADHPKSKSLWATRVDTTIAGGLFPRFASLFFIKGLPEESKFPLLLLLSFAC